MDVDKALVDVESTNETYVNTQDAPITENGAQATGGNPAQMEADAKMEALKKKIKKTNIPVFEYVYGYDHRTGHAVLWFFYDMFPFFISRSCCGYVFPVFEKCFIAEFDKMDVRLLVVELRIT
ncbi:hypothetical protein L1987_77900 [Smallanthus sonchifolius]|uniref:Uncharacterized protein n=2 Tax=Smallanthus sonchifolius TaxID=185202 RepID=A0ACB8ZBD7_9ASTR|nr:hypothetical protein L1987_77896 [Smallanthus sonchifolius]KAI3694916.1 hypothetical protein L1987_77900 [Smallanthus sonchifolius]